MQSTWNLCVHSCYDFLNSNIVPQKYINFLLNQKITKATLVGVNSLFGLLPFYYQAKKKQIEPVIGLTIPQTIYLQKTFTVTFFAQNFKGYQNLVQISSMVMTNQQSEFDLTKNLSLLNNLSIVITLNDHHTLTQFYDLWQFLQKQENDSYFGLSDFKTDLTFWTNKQLLAKILPFPSIYYLQSNEQEVHQVLQAIKKQTKCLFERVDSQHFYSLPELKIKLGKYGFLLKNISTFLLKIKLELPDSFPFNLKQATVPQPFASNIEYLESLCQQQLQKINPVNIIKYQNRLHFELKIIAQKKLVDYFLIVADYVQFAIKENILVGPGRGSASGSLVAYLLGITKVDPVHYDLIFERFLNPARNEIPDIDLDFEDQKRNQVLDYIFHHYGFDYVAQITTFQKMALKLAIRDVGRAIAIAPSEIDKITKAVPLKFNHSFQEALQNKLSLRSYQKKYPRLFALSEKIIGLPRHVSIHAAGLVIANRPLTESVAIWKDSMNRNILQAEMYDLNVLGLIKMDLLGLKNLTTVATVLEQIDLSIDKNNFLNTINLSDQATFANLQTGATTGIFQLESAGMTELLHQLQPRTIDDIATTISLYRPGAMANKDLFLARKKNNQVGEYLISQFQPILKSTYGIPIFQEQIVQMIKVFSHLTAGEAEMLRKAIAKKDEHLINSMHQIFCQKAQVAKHSWSLIEKVWQWVVKFADYGFNRSHAISYSFLVYWMSYLKTHYFLEFMIALANDVISDPKKTIDYFIMLRSKKVQILPPNLDSPSLFYQKTNNHTLACPLPLIKKITSNWALKIIEERQNHGAFIDFFDFVVRIVKIGGDRELICQLIDSGTLDQFGHNRATLNFNLDNLLLTANYILVKKQQEIVIDRNLLSQTPHLIVKERNIQQLLINEINVYGFALSYHYLDEFIKQNQQKMIEQKLRYFSLAFIRAKKFGKYKTVVLIDAVEHGQTRTGKDIIFLQVSDRSGVLPKLIALSSGNLFSHLTPGKIICLQISISNTFKKLSFFLDRVFLTS